VWINQIGIGHITCQSRWQPGPGRFRKMSAYCKWIVFIEVRGRPGCPWPLRSAV